MTTTARTLPRSRSAARALLWGALALAAGCGEPDPEGTIAGHCTDAADNDGDGLFDCADDGCSGAPECNEGRTSGDCADGADNDGDSAFDCDDSGCTASPDCAPPLEEGASVGECQDALDNDGDGAYDCDDTGCEIYLPCHPTGGVDPTTMLLDLTFEEWGTLCAALVDPNAAARTVECDFDFEFELPARDQAFCISYEDDLKDHCGATAGDFADFWDLPELTDAQWCAEEEWPEDPLRDLIVDCYSTRIPAPERDLLDLTTEEWEVLCYDVAEIFPDTQSADCGDFSGSWTPPDVDECMALEHRARPHCGATVADLRAYFAEQEFTDDELCYLTERDYSDEYRAVWNCTLAPIEPIEITSIDLNCTPNGAPDVANLELSFNDWAADVQVSVRDTTPSGTRSETWDLGFVDSNNSGQSCPGGGTIDDASCDAWWHRRLTGQVAPLDPGETAFACQQFVFVERRLPDVAIRIEVDAFRDDSSECVIFGNRSREIYGSDCICGEEWLNPVPPLPCGNFRNYDPDPPWEQGVEAFGVDGEGRVTLDGNNVATGYTGETQVYDRIVDNGGGTGEVGDLLCNYVYPATGTPISLTRPGHDEANANVNVTCVGCRFAFDVAHGAPTVAEGGILSGAYCDIFGYPASWSGAGPGRLVDDMILAYHPTFDDPNTPAHVTAPTLLTFYDGLGTETYEDAPTIEIPAQWYSVGTASLQGTAFEWDWPIATYDYYEIGYFE